MDFEINDVMKAIAENFDLNIDELSTGGANITIEGDSKDLNNDLFEDEDIMRTTETNNEIVRERKNIINKHVENNIDRNKVSIKNNMKIYTPVLTRNTISKFEYVAVITKLAKYLHALPTLPAIVDSVLTDDVKINNIINPSELAWILLRKGVYNPVFDRGYEKVSFSELTINPTWNNLIEDYFRSQHEAIEKELLNEMFAH